MKETTVRLGRKYFIAEPEVDIPPAVAERMARAIDQRIEAAVLQMLFEAAPPKPRSVGIRIDPVS